MIIMWARIAIVTSRRVQTDFGTIGTTGPGRRVTPAGFKLETKCIQAFFSSVQFRHPLSMA